MVQKSDNSTAFSNGMGQVNGGMAVCTYLSLMAKLKLRSGVYKVIGRGEVNATSYLDLPVAVRKLWSRVAGYEGWGQSLISKRNKELSEKLENQGWCDGFIDSSKLESVERDGFAKGLLTMPLVMLKCVGFDKHWYERVERYGYPPNVTSRQRKAYVKETERLADLGERRQHWEAVARECESEQEN
ncbi:hypothetical protein BT69DRAFT_1335193 [Atractiella rhizophila]|nr:hypothetical protein BT69DRAFT_1335193 [Atractiella rhizophila]